MIPVWTERNTWVKTFINDGVSIIDWGCGNKDILRYVKPLNYLGIDKDLPADIIANFNKEIPVIETKYDVGLVLGVLEYLDNPEYFLKSIKHSADTFIVLCLANRYKKEEWQNVFSAEDFNNLLIPLWKKVSFERKGNYILAICSN